MICGTAAMIVLTVKYPLEMQFHNNSYIPAIGIATAVIGSLLPDADLKTTTAARKLGLIGSITSKLFTHRGLTHTLLFPALIYLLMASITVPVVPSLLLGLLVGWVAHILADMFNGRGVPLFWPIYRNRLNILDIPLGTIPEAIFSFFWIAACVAMGVWF